MTPAVKRYAHIDALRALAVLIVVLSHAGFERVVPGSTGVTIFFTISGFIITTVLLKELSRSGAFDPAGFYIRRAFKLLPPFLVLIALPTLVYAQFEYVDPRQFLSQAFFTFNWIYMGGGGHDVLPGSGVVWSLAIEEQFYIAFAVYWLFGSRRPRYKRDLAVLAVACIVGALVARMILVGQGATDIRILYGTETRVDSIAIGILGALLFSESTTIRPGLRRILRAVRSDRILVVVGVLLAFSVVFRDPLYKQLLRFDAESLATVILILYGLLAAPSRLRTRLDVIAGSRIVQVIGLSSYSIYLAHLTLIKALEPHLEGVPPGVRVLLLAVLGVLAGIASWASIERYALVLKDRAMHRMDARRV